MLSVVAPVFHKYVPPPEAVNVVLFPIIIATSDPALAVGKAFTVTSTASESDVMPSDTVTLYVVVDEGLTVILAVVAPVLHVYDVPPVAVNVVFDPSHMETSAPALATTANGFTLT